MRANVLALITNPVYVTVIVTKVGANGTGIASVFVRMGTHVLTNATPTVRIEEMFTFFKTNIAKAVRVAVLMKTGEIAIRANAVFPRAYVPTGLVAYRAIFVLVLVRTYFLANPTNAFGIAVHTFDVTICAFARLLLELMLAVKIANITGGFVIPKIVRTIAVAKRAIAVLPRVFAGWIFGF